MEVKTKVDKVITLNLSENEAIWLKSFIQNYPGDPINELPEDLEIRKELWEFLTDQGIEVL